MPVLSEQQQNALGDRGNVDQERKAVRRHKPSGSMPNKKKKQARWSLGKDSKGRRISFGFRDENAQKSFTTPTRDRSNKYKNDSASAKFDDTVRTDFGDIDDNDFENTDRNNHRQQVPLQTPNTAMKRKIMMEMCNTSCGHFLTLSPPQPSVKLAWLCKWNEINHTYLNKASLDTFMLILHAGLRACD